MEIREYSALVSKMLGMLIQLECVSDAQRMKLGMAITTMEDHRLRDLVKIMVELFTQANKSLGIPDDDFITIEPFPLHEIFDVGEDDD